MNVKKLKNECIKGLYDTIPEDINVLDALKLFAMINGEISIMIRELSKDKRLILK